MINKNCFLVFAMLANVLTIAPFKESEENLSMSPVATADQSRELKLNLYMASGPVDKMLPAGKIFSTESTIMDVAHAVQAHALIEQGKILHQDQIKLTLQSQTEILKDEAKLGSLVESDQGSLDLTLAIIHDPLLVAIQSLANWGKRNGYEQCVASFDDLSDKTVGLQILTSRAPVITIFCRILKSDYPVRTLAANLINIISKQIIEKMHYMISDMKHDVFSKPLSRWIRKNAHEEHRARLLYHHKGFKVTIRQFSIRIETFADNPAFYIAFSLPAPPEFANCAKLLTLKSVFDIIKAVTQSVHES